MDIVIDANITVALFIHLSYSTQAEERFRSWREGGDRLFAPSLWLAEIVSALKKMQANKQITSDDAWLALSNLMRLQVEVILPDRSLLESSFEWAGKLGQTVAYDAQYVALAASLQAQFWTADKRLYRLLKDSGVNWVNVVAAD